MSITINRVIEIIANDNEVTTLYVLSFFNNHSRHHSSLKFDVNVRCYTNLCCGYWCPRGVYLSVVSNN